MELWKVVSEFPEYEISNKGNLRRLTYCNQFGTVILKTPKILKPANAVNGYKAFVFSVSNKKYRRLIHRLVAEAFIEKQHGRPWVAHNDGNPANNHVENLRWANPSENAMDMRLHGTMQDGEKSVSCKLTESQILEIRRSYIPRKVTQYQLSEKYGVSVSHINRILNNVRWKHLY